MHLVDGELPHLRTSERRDFKRCPQRWYWGWVDCLGEVGPPDIKLWFGSGWHLVMEHWYQPGLKRGRNPLKVWRDWCNDECVKIRTNFLGSERFKDDDYVDALPLGEAMLGAYFDKYGRDEHMYMIQTERAFQVRIRTVDGSGLLLEYDGTYDGVYRDETDGSLWLLENKTAKTISTGHLPMDDQGGSYWAVATTDLRAAKLIGPKESLSGVMYNFARKAMPDNRPKNEDGLATNKPVKEHYLAQLNSGAIATLGPKPTLAGLEQLAKDCNVVVLGEVSKSQPSPLFVREPIYRTIRQRNTQLRRIQAEGTHMAAMRSGLLPVYKNPTRDCSWDCKFYTMCTLHENGTPDWEDFAEAVYTHVDPYADHRKSADAGTD